MKLWAMLCRVTQDERVMVESSDKTWSTGKGNGKPLRYPCLENPMNSMKRQKDRTLKDELHRSIGAQYATGYQWRITPERMKGWSQSKNNTQLWMWLGDRSKVWCCKEQYRIGTCNVSSINQGKLEVVKQEMARVNIDIPGISELRWTGMGEFNSDDHYILEKAMAPHSSTLAWKIPWMEEPGRLQSMGSLRVGHDWAISL